MDIVPFETMGNQMLVSQACMMGLSPAKLPQKQKTSLASISHDWSQARLSLILACAYLAHAP